MKARLAQLRTLAQLHPIWSPRLDVASMAAYALLVIGTVLMSTIPLVNEPMRSKGPVLAVILGGSTLIVAVQVIGDIRRYRQAKRLLTNNPGAGSEAFTHNRQFCYWVLLRSVNHDATHRHNELSLTMAYIRYQQMLRRGELMWLVMGVLTEGFLLPVHNIRRACKTLKNH